MHRITTGTPDGRRNANLTTWVRQAALGGQMLAGARYESDYTIELVRESGVFNLHPLAQSQTALIQKLGRKSGRGGDKFKRLPHALDASGCPYLGKTIGYVSCRVTGTGAAGDHTILRRGVPRRVILNPDQPVLTHHYLRQKGWVRG